MTSQSEYIKAIKGALTIADVCRNLGLLPRGANYETIKHKIVEYSIDVSHFTHPVSLGKNHGKPRQSPKLLKQELIHLRGHVCEVCSFTKWKNKPIPLQLEHINGDHTDDHVDNLLLLCPNCHSDTDTWKRKKATTKIKYFCSECGGEKKTKASILCKKCSVKQNSLQKAPFSGVKKQDQKSSCQDCKKQIKYLSIFCASCSRKPKNAPSLPPMKELAERVKSSGIPLVAAELKVSDSLLRKRLSRYMEGLNENS